MCRAVHPSFSNFKKFLLWNIQNHNTPTNNKQYYCQQRFLNFQTYPASANLIVEQVDKSNAIGVAKSGPAIQAGAYWP